MDGYTSAGGNGECAWTMNQADLVNGEYFIVPQLLFITRSRRIGGKGWQKVLTAQLVASHLLLLIGCQIV